MLIVYQYALTCTWLSRFKLFIGIIWFIFIYYFEFFLKFIIPFNLETSKCNLFNEGNTDVYVVFVSIPFLQKWEDNIYVASNVYIIIVAVNYAKLMFISSLSRFNNKRYNVRAKLYLNKNIHETHLYRDWVTIRIAHEVRNEMLRYQQ